MVEKLLVSKPGRPSSEESRSSLRGKKWSFAPGTNLSSGSSIKIERESRQKLNDFAKELRSFRSVDMSGKFETVENRDYVFVDVRDVAEALLLVFEKLEASGRCICGAHNFHFRNFFEKLEGMYPNYKYPKNFTEGGKEMKVSPEKLKKLGWTYRPVEGTLVDTIECIKEAGL